MSLPEVLLWRSCAIDRAASSSGGNIPRTITSLDFACLEARLGIEVDGEAHSRGDRPAARRSTRCAIEAAWLRDASNSCARRVAESGRRRATIVDQCRAGPPPPPGLPGGPPPRSGRICRDHRLSSSPIARIACRVIRDRPDLRILASSASPAARRRRRRRRRGRRIAWCTAARRGPGARSVPPACAVRTARCPRARRAARRRRTRGVASGHERPGSAAEGAARGYVVLRAGRAPPQLE